MRKHQATYRCARGYRDTQGWAVGWFVATLVHREEEEVADVIFVCSSLPEKSEYEQASLCQNLHGLQALL